MFGLLVLAILATPGLASVDSSNTGLYQQTSTTQASSEYDSLTTARAANISMAVTFTQTSVIETKPVKVATSPTEIIISTTSSAQDSSQNRATSTASVSGSLQSSVSSVHTERVNSLLLLSGIALVMALGSMLFVRRKVDEEPSEKRA